MFAQQRHTIILDELAEHGRVTVKELASRLDVADETIRRDLDQLASTDALERVHGGAILRHTTHPESDLNTRLATNAETKTRIARKAAAFLPGDGGSIIIDAGSTTAALTPFLPHTELSVLTHAPSIAIGLVDEGVQAVHLLPGKVRPTTRAAVGPATLNALSSLSPTTAFVGCNGVTPEGFCTADPDEAAVKTALMRRSTRVVMLADSSKFFEQLLVTFSDWELVDVLVTDAALPTALARIAHKNNVEVVVA